VHDGFEWQRHGDSSLALWQIRAVEPCAVELRAVVGSSWVLTRQVIANESGLTILSRARNVTGEPRPCTWGQHIIFPWERVASVGVDASWTWMAGSPHAPRRGESLMRIDPRFAASLDVASVNGCAKYRVDFVNGLALEVAWDTAAYPFLWVWREHGSHAHPWHGRGSFLGLEPMSVDNELGLATAVSAGAARWVPAGAEIEAHVSMTVRVDADRPRSAEEALRGRPGG
jgi:galactose mutarotase-like enzyme